MGTLVNKTTVMSSIAIVGGLFIYKQFIEQHINKAIAGGAE